MRNTKPVQPELTEDEKKEQERKMAEAIKHHEIMMKLSSPSEKEKAEIKEKLAEYWKDYAAAREKARPSSPKKPSLETVLKWVSEHPQEEHPQEQSPNISPFTVADLANASEKSKKPDTSEIPKVPNPKVTRH